MYHFHVATIYPFYPFLFTTKLENAGHFLKYRGLNIYASEIFFDQELETCPLGRVQILMNPNTFPHYKNLTVVFVPRVKNNTWVDQRHPASSQESVNDLNNHI